ncbi:MAG: hypothetical protein KGZ85_07915 [Ignavibacterium sp.]|nr:hypothetical protein [Ignavibacterium sp.]
MARKRMIDPHFFESAQDKGWTSDDCTVMMAAISAADDEGRGRIKSLTDKISGIVTDRKLKKCVQRLQYSIVFYSKIYYFLPKWEEYQKVSHPIPSKYPDPKLFINKDLTSKNSGINPEPLRKDSTTGKYSLKELSLNKVSVDEGNVDNSNGNHQTSNLEISLPLLTEISDYAPIDYENREHVTEAVKNLLNSFCNIEHPDKATLSSFTNIVMNTKQVKNQTAFEYLFNTFNEFHTYPEGKRNLGYLYKRLKGRIDDALIEARERKAKQIKQKENAEINIVHDEDIEQLANKMKFD